MTCKLLLLFLKHVLCRWRNSNAETLTKIAVTVEDSTKSGHNIPQLVQKQNKRVVFFTSGVIIYILIILNH